MKNIYDEICNEFQKKNCQLLTSKEEYNGIISTLKNGSYRLRYIASCGHEHVVFYNVFKARNTGVICPTCRAKYNGKKSKDIIDSGFQTKISKIEQEFNVIQILRQLLQNDFDFKKNFDGCKVDISLKPKTEKEDKWIGIQVKTSNILNSTYSFHINNEYTNCLILLYCCYDDSIWLIPENVISNQQKISIGRYKSKYDIYKTNIQLLAGKISELYTTTSKHTFEMLDTPINFYQQREQEFRYFRENIIQYLNFVYDEMEGLVYDFKVNGLKVQEKVCSFNTYKNAYLCNICKNGKNNKEETRHIQYDKGDNDIYWINCSNKKNFFVIPENILIDRGYVGDREGKIFLKLKIENLKTESDWFTPFLFDYHTISMDVNKTRLLVLLSAC